METAKEEEEDFDKMIENIEELNGPSKEGDLDCKFTLTCSIWK